MRVLEIHPGREKVTELSVGERRSVRALKMEEAERGLKAALGGAFRIDVEPIPGLDGHVLTVDRVDRYSTNGPAFFLKSDPTCLINGVGIVLATDGEGLFADARATPEQVLDLVGFVKQVDRPLPAPVSRR